MEHFRRGALERHQKEKQRILTEVGKNKSNSNSKKRRKKCKGGGTFTRYGSEGPASAMFDCVVNVMCSDRHGDYINQVHEGQDALGRLNTDTRNWIADKNADRKKEMQHVNKQLERKEQRKAEKAGLEARLQQLKREEKEEHIACTPKKKTEVKARAPKRKLVAGTYRIGAEKETGYARRATSPC